MDLVPLDLFRRRRAAERAAIALETDSRGVRAALAETADWCREHEVALIVGGGFAAGAIGSRYSAVRLSRVASMMASGLSLALSLPFGTSARRGAKPE